MRQKGFTLIELMVVVAIVGVMAALIIPQFERFRVEQKASQNIEKGVTMSSVKDKSVKDKMAKILEAKKAERERDARVDALASENTNNTVPTVLKDEVVPQSVNNTVPTVLYPDMVITCKDRDTLISKCTLNINQSGKRYLIPMNCEVSGLNEYKCEGF